MNPEQRDGLQRVNRAGKHLLSLIMDVIDISKIEGGKLRPSLTWFSLEDAIDEAVDEVRSQLDAKGLELEIDASSWPRLHSDKQRLQQCLLKYLSNAIKFTESGRVYISVREEGDKVEISVTDSGIGIAEEDVPRLFTAFERLESRLRVRAGGTGLGLYLVKQIVSDVLGGDVSVRSRLDEGSTFSITIPKEIHLADGKSDKEKLAL